MRARDIKRSNRLNIMSAILKHDSLSRIEIAHEVGLSPSTVSGLVAGLMDDGYLVETGARTSTGGRSRVELALNKELGSIAVVEVGRSQVRLVLFDMGLGQRDELTLEHEFASGNDLLALILAGLSALTSKADVDLPEVVGMGLLFQRDQDASGLNVMYSTGISSATIPLATALFTQLRIPVIEEYAPESTAVTALDRMKQERTSGAYLSLGAEVLASVVVRGAPVPLRGGIFANVEPLLGAMTREEAAPASAATSEIEATPEDARQLAGAKPVAPERLAQAIGLLYTLFPLDMVVIAGPRELVSERFIKATEGALHRCLEGATVPWLEWLHLNGTGSLTRTCAGHVRRTVLLQE